MGHFILHIHIVLTLLQGFRLTNREEKAVVHIAMLVIVDM